MFGDDSEEVTPVPIPNTEVKLFSANGSWGLSPCESRTLPSTKKSQNHYDSGFFVQKWLRKNTKVKLSSLQITTSQDKNIP